MTNPIFFADANEVSDLSVDDVYELTGTEGHHAATVKRLSQGESVDLVDGRGLRLECIVQSAQQGVLTVRVAARRRELPAIPTITLVQALAKDGRDELAIETATELGVDTIIPWQAERSIVRWKADRAEKSLAKWRKIVQAAAKQARRAWLPEVTGLLDSTALAQLGSSAKLLVLHEQASGSLADLPDLAECQQLLIIVGPEGGISPRELELFASAGAVQLRLGQHVLRSSTAGPAAISVLSQHLGRW
ncbi:16S rRNA (uracil(1498)-N(3))-methyltransferase [Psychromicrobium lacuslunae]|uniref:Ribosomal RNA small subunit methyltransferase E n=1 Tax=Psychromicrobium lacuslunae TaxID=1618207 RepID=A0A0D4BX54_9MICC|nr:16S rRNA (uracil(1498)-N(3))-methyltransferase [Psychromicrobium lacuslunae]AJT41012.1 16S rRNA methyltransferase [Psychromicrobium lacuslunae]